MTIIDYPFISTQFMVPWPHSGGFWFLRFFVGTNSTTSKTWIHATSLHDEDATWSSWMADSWIWLVVWNIFYFPIYWESHHPNRLSYFSEGFKQLPTRLLSIVSFIQKPTRRFDDTSQRATEILMI